MINEEEINMLVEQKVNIIKDKFITELSHELRTPITSIKLAVALMKVENNEDKRNVYLNIIEQESERQITYINKLLDNNDHDYVR